MNVHNQLKVKEQNCRHGISFPFFAAMLIVFVLDQNPDWENELLWWGSIGLLCVVFFIGCKGIFVFERNYTVWVLAFFVFGAFSLLWAVNSSLVGAMLKTMLINMLILFLIRSAIQSEKDVERVLAGVLISILINIAWLLVTNQSMFGDTGGQDEIIDRLGSDSLWNSNTIGIMAAIAMLIALYFRKKTRKKMMRWLFLGIVALMFFAVLLSGSRKALLMVLMGLCGFVLVTAKRKRLRAVLIIGLAVFALYYLVIEVPYFYSIIGWRVEGFLASFTGAGNVDGSARVREKYVVDALRVWFERPLLGCGLDCYREVNEVRKGMYAHNNYAELLADLGVIGAAIYYSAYVYCIGKLIKIKQKNNLVWLLLLVLIIFAVMDYGCVSYNSLLYGILLMLTFSIICVYNKKTCK